MKIKVVKLDGTEPGVSAYFIRWIIRPVDLFFYGGVAILCILAGGKGQRLGDMAAGTSVIKLKSKVENPKQDIIKKIERTDYIPTFDEARNLNDKDIGIILQVLQHYRETAQKKPVIALHQKIIRLLEIETDMEPVVFLNTIVKDFNHFAVHG